MLASHELITAEKQYAPSRERMYSLINPVRELGLYAVRYPKKTIDVGGKVVFKKPAKLSSLVLLGIMGGRVSSEFHTGLTIIPETNKLMLTGASFNQINPYPVTVYLKTTGDFEIPIILRTIPEAIALFKLVEHELSYAEFSNEKLQDFIHTTLMLMDEIKDSNTARAIRKEHVFERHAYTSINILTDHTGLGITVEFMGLNYKPDTATFKLTFYDASLYKDTSIGIMSMGEFLVSPRMRADTFIQTPAFKKLQRMSLKAAKVYQAHLERIKYAYISVMTYAT